MSEIKKYYDNYWDWVGKLPESAYERDLVFPKIFQKNEKILDLACGNGNSSLQIAKITRAPVYGLDFSKIAVNEAKNKGILAKNGDVEERFPFETGKFDTVFWGDNIEHIFFPEKTIKEIYRVLKTGGRLVLSTPNIAYWRYRLSYLLTGSIPDTEYNGKHSWEWSHIRFFNRKILNDFLDASHFKLTKVWGINRRFGDKWLVNFLPDLFGMIMVVEAVKSK